MALLGVMNRACSLSGVNCVQLYVIFFFQIMKECLKQMINKERFVGNKHRVSTMDLNYGNSSTKQGRSPIHQWVVKIPDMEIKIG